MRSAILSCSNGFLSMDQSSTTIKCIDALFIGNITGLELVISDSLILIGSGRLNNIVADRLITISRNAPLFINRVYGRKCYLSGSRFPIIVNEIICSNTYLYKCLVNILQTNNVVIGENVTVKNISVKQEIVFNDPYVWFENMNLKPSTRVVFNYDESIYGDSE
ncbi:MAG: hypothetical protein QXT88_03600 [Desulfurococcaceae archaeon]